MAVALRCEAGRARRYAAPMRADARRLMALCGVAACELSVVIAGDDFVRRLNREYRGKDKATDVLSFSQLEVAVPAPRAALPRAARGRRHGAADGALISGAAAPEMSAPRPPGRLPDGAQAGSLAPRPGTPLGDVVISADTAERQARRRGLAPEERMRTLLVHGLLHVLGYDHERSPIDARRMFARERELTGALAAADGAALARVRASAGAVPAGRRRLARSGGR